MNAPTNVSGSKRRDAYLPAIGMFVPGADDEERQIRASIMLMRDQASSAMRYAGDEAYRILQTVEQIATIHCFAPASLATLKELRRQLILLTSSASVIEALFKSGGGDADVGR